MKTKNVDKSEGIPVYLRARHKATLERVRSALGPAGYANLNDWFNTQLERLADRSPKTRKKRAAPKKRKTVKKAPAPAPASADQAPA